MSRSSNPLFTTCPRCGNKTALPVQTCARCFHTIPRASTAPSAVFTVCFVIALVAALMLAWQRYFVTPPPFLGSWKNGRTAFIFHKDGRLDADGYFAEDGTFHEATRITTGRWSVLAGNLLTLQGGKPGGELRPAARVQWKLSSDGKSLVLSGLGRTDNFASEVKLYAKSGS